MPLLVALHPEGVDRNSTFNKSVYHKSVALHPEGVDRNELMQYHVVNTFMSPSTRRAWIEIVFALLVSKGSPVVLHPEGVDRNLGNLLANGTRLGHPPPGGRG